jgi:hypothetical protein
MHLLIPFPNFFLLRTVSFLVPVKQSMIAFEDRSHDFDLSIAFASTPHCNAQAMKILPDNLHYIDGVSADVALISQYPYMDVMIRFRKPACLNAFL